MSINCDGPGTEGTINSISVRKVLTAFDERWSELVTTGTFDSNIDDWGDLGSWTSGSAVWDDGAIAVTASSYQGAAQDITGLTIGDVYEISFDVTAVTGGDTGRLYVGPSSNPSANAVLNQISLSVGSYTYTFTATATSHGVGLSSTSGGNTITYDNISVKRVPYPNLVTNGTFDTDSDWTKGTDWSIGSGVLSAGGTGGFTSADITIATTGKNFYRILAYVTTTSGQLRWKIGTTQTAYGTYATGWHEIILRSSGDNDTFSIVSANFNGSIDNVSVQELPASIDRKYYLDTDGSDDMMEVTPTLNLGEQWWHVGAWQSDIGGRYAFATTASSTGGLRDGSDLWKWRNAADTGQETLINFDPATLHVLTVEQAGTNSISGRANGANSAGAITPYDDSGDTQGLALFSSRNNYFSGGLDGRFYGGSWGQGQVDYDELTVLQDYLGTTTQPPIDPPDVTEYADVYELLAAQTGAVLFDINDKTSLRVGRDGSGGVPVDGDPVGMMLDVSDTGGATVAAATAARPELVTNGTFDSNIDDWGDLGNWTSGSAVWDDGAIAVTVFSYQGAAQDITGLTIGDVYEISLDVTAVTGGDTGRLYVGPSNNPSANAVLNQNSLSVGSYTYTFTATATSHSVGLSSTSGGNTITYDNISVKRVPYPNLVTNGTFDTDSDWNKGTDWSIGSGVASKVAGTAAGLDQASIITEFKWYRVTFYATVTAGTFTPQFRGGATVSGEAVNSSGWSVQYIFASTGSTDLRFLANSAAAGSIDNVIVQEVPASIDRKYYLDTDGSDDWMQVTPTLNLGEQWWHVGAWQSDGTGIWGFGTNSVFQGGLIFKGTGEIGWRNSGNTGYDDLTSGADFTIPFVATIEQADTNSISGYANGALSVGLLTPYDDSGSVGGLALFSSENDRFSAGIDGRFYGGSWGQGQVDYDELTVLQDYLGTTTQPPIDPTDVTAYANVYELSLIHISEPTRPY